MLPKTTLYEEPRMHCESIELGFVTNLTTLRDVLRGLNADGTRWWLASDPADSVSKGYISIGHGYPNCIHPLNAAYYRIPVLNKQLPITSAEEIVVVIEPSVCVAEQPGYYFEDGKLIANDALESFLSFFTPLKAALLTRLRARG
jgi:hypothetical protein